MELASEIARRLALAVLAVALAACDGQEAAAPAPPEAVAVDVAIGGAGVRITAVYPVDEFPIVRGDRAHLLGFRLEGAAGELITAGTIPDPRVVHSEGTEAGPMQRVDVDVGF